MDKIKCARCGYSEFNSSLHIHHIDLNHDNMDNENNQDIREIEGVIHAARISLSDERTEVLYLRAIAQTGLLILKELRKPKV